MFTAFLARNNPVRAINANNTLQKMEQHRSGDFDKKLYLPAAIQALQQSKCTPQQKVRTILALDADSDPQLFRYTSALACNRSSSKWFPFADKVITRSTAFLLFTLFATTHPFSEAFSEVVQKPRGHDWQKNIFANSTGGKLNKLKFMEWLAEMAPDLNPENLYQNLKSYMDDFHVSGYSASKPEYYIDLPGGGSKYDLSLPKEGIKYPQLVPVIDSMQTEEVVATQNDMEIQTDLCADAATEVELVAREEAGTQAGFCADANTQADAVAQREMSVQAAPGRTDAGTDAEAVVRADTSVQAALERTDAGTDAEAVVRADTSVQAALERTDVGTDAEAVVRADTSVQAAPKHADAAAGVEVVVADTSTQASLEQAHTSLQTEGSLTADGNAYVRVHMMVTQQDIVSVEQNAVVPEALATGNGSHLLNSQASSRGGNSPDPILNRFTSDPISVGSDDPERRSPSEQKTYLGSVLAPHNAESSVALPHQSESHVLMEEVLPKAGVNVVSTAAETEEDEDNYETESDSDWGGSDTEEEFDAIFSSEHLATAKHPIVDELDWVQK